MAFEQSIPFRPGDILLQANDGQIILEDILSKDDLLNNPEGRNIAKLGNGVTLHYILTQQKKQLALKEEL